LLGLLSHRSATSGANSSLAQQRILNNRPFDVAEFNSIILTMSFQCDNKGLTGQRDIEWGIIASNVQTQSSPSSSGSESGSATMSEASITELPSSVRDFFADVSAEGFPQGKRNGATARAQPWKKVWDGPQKPSEDGKLLVACPKRCDYGSNGLGGY